MSSWSSMMKIEGSGSASGSESGSVSQRQGSADPYPDFDPHQNFMDPQHCFFLILSFCDLCLFLLAMVTSLIVGVSSSSSSSSSCNNDWVNYKYLLLLGGSVGDPDPHVFGPPGSGTGSISQRYGSGSRSGSFPNSHKGVERTERFFAK